MRFEKNFLLATTLLTGAALAPVLAHAQTTPPDAKTSEKKADQAKEKATDVEGVIITGSHIRKDEYTSSSPIQVITREQSDLRGQFDTAEILQNSTVASGFQVNNLLTGYVETGGEGVNTINLRGLGADRTLVLLNGRRLPPAGVGGTVGPVDLNTIPASIIDRVEILKDGASSVYGSDAVAGVVNLITKKRTDGLELDVTGTKPEKAGGGSQYRVSATWGKVFDKGYFNISADYTEIDPLIAKDRSYTACSPDYVTSPTTGQRVDTIDPSTGKPKCFNLLNNNWVANNYFGGVFQYDPTLAGGPYPSSALGLRGVLPDWVRAGRGGHPETYPYETTNTPLYGQDDVISPVRRETIYATGGYNLTSNIEAYSEVLLNKRDSSNFYARQLFPTVDPTNPMNTVAAGLIAGSGGGSNGYAEPIIAIPQSDRQSVTYERVVGGLKGDLPWLKGWTWDAYGMFGNSDGAYTDSFVYQDRVNATSGPGVACNPALITGPTPTTACPAIPWFSPSVLAGNFSSAEQAFLFGQETGHTNYQQFTFEASITGDLFTLPAGKVSGAFGIDYRHDHIDDQPGPNAQASNFWGYTTSGRTVGSDAVKEIYGELNIPLLKGLPFIQALTLDGSIRYTDYDSYGGNETHKLGLNWQIIPSIRLRGTTGTSFRAPSPYELYLANQSSYFNGFDPCTNWGSSSSAKLASNCAAAGVPSNYGGYTTTPTVYQGGGVGRLKPETSKATTASIIWTPKFADLNVDVDYTQIEVDNEVANFGAQNILNQCYLGIGTYPNDFCKLFTRDPTTHDVLTINDDFENISTQKYSGLDLNVRYRRNLGFAKFEFNTQATWNFRNVTNLLGGQAINNLGYITEPAFTAVANIRFDRKSWTVNWGLNMIGRQSDVSIDGGPVQYSGEYGTNVGFKYYTNAVVYHSLTIRKKFDKFSIALGVKNLFDQQPPALSAGEFRDGSAALNQYDMLGRQIFVSLNKKW